jgi:DNA-binding winged helix-turn-helix (wHTH) protein/TolB-like protein
VDLRREGVAIASGSAAISETIETTPRSYRHGSDCFVAYCRPVPLCRRHVQAEEVLATTSLRRFADCELDPTAYEIRRAGQPCAVEPQVFDLLVYLVRNAGRLVTKDELVANVWGRIVSDAALSSRIKSARRAIGDDGERQHLIKTVHGRGFRFVGRVLPGEGEGLGAATGPVARGLDEPGRGRPVVAVLPLRPGGPDDADRYLADAVTDEIIMSLARDRSVAVSTAGVTADKAADRHVWPAGVQTARYVIEGSVRRSSGGMVAAIRLTDVTSGMHMWAERFEQSVATALSADQGVAHRICAVLAGEIETAEARRAAAEPPEKRDSSALYHLGLQELYRFTPQGRAAARRLFEQAVAADPAFASAYARLAYVHIQDYWYGSHEHRPLVLDRACDLASRAVLLDRKNALGHFALGRVHALRGAFDPAMDAFETAIRLNPILAQAHFALGQAHFFAGRHKEAIRRLEAAIELNPHEPHLWSFFHDQADAYYALGNLDEAARRARIASCFPNATHWPFATLASVLGSAGRIEEAHAAAHELRARSPGYTLTFAEEELSHIADREHVTRVLHGLKAAGLPDGLEHAPCGAVDAARGRH